MKPLALLLAATFLAWAALPIASELWGAWMGTAGQYELGSGVALDLDGGAE